MEVNSKQLQTPFEISTVQHRPGDPSVDLFIENEVVGLNIGGGTGLTGSLRIQNILHTQPGQTALHATYTGFSRTSLVGALNALVDGTVPLGSITPNLTAVLAAGNVTGVNDIVITSGQKLTGQAELTLAAFGPTDMTFSARGASTVLNQVGQTALHATYTGASRASLIGALNAVVDGTLAIQASPTTLGFFGTSPVVKATVAGSRAGNAALASLLTALAGYGLVTDSSVV